MKTFKYKNKIYRYIYVKLARIFKSEERVRYPKNVDAASKVAADIFIKVLTNPDAQLYYNLKTEECSLKLEEHRIFIFLERSNIKVINSTFGYDKQIPAELEYYLVERFIRENNKRRILMKEFAIAKVDNSLYNTLEKLNESF